MGGDESDPGRRRWLRALVAGTAAVTFSSRSSAMPKNTADKFIVFVFGDSILDGARNKNFNHECHHCGACPTVWGACRHPRAFSWRRSLFTRTIEPSLRGASEVRAAFLPAYCEHATLKSVKAGRGVGFFGLKLPVDGGCAGVKVRCPKMKEGQASLEHGHPRRVL